MKADFRLKAAAFFAAAALLSAALIAYRSSDVTASAVADSAAGKALYSEYCAACHGANLEGQPDWKRPKVDGKLPAPPHDASGHTWHHSDRVLAAITRDGLSAFAGQDYATDMPAFAGTLTDAEISAVLAYIKSTWSEPEIAYQAEITANDEGE